jgi:uncharacterized integral membrane protein
VSLEQSSSKENLTVEIMKPVVIIVLTLLVSIVLLQNTQAIETKLLFITATMPKALLLIRTLLVGFSFGIIVTNLLGANPSSHKDSMSTTE